MGPPPSVMGGANRYESPINSDAVPKILTPQKLMSEQESGAVRNRVPSSGPIKGGANEAQDLKQQRQPLLSKQEPSK